MKKKYFLPNIYEIRTVANKDTYIIFFLEDGRYFNDIKEKSNIKTNSEPARF